MGADERAAKIAQATRLSWQKPDEAKLRADQIRAAHHDPIRRGTRYIKTAIKIVREQLTGPDDGRHQNRKRALRKLEGARLDLEAPEAAA